MKTKLQKFADVKLEVKLANPDLDNYGVTYIAKIVFAQLESAWKTNKSVEELKEHFWNVHKREKESKGSGSERKYVARVIMYNLTVKEVNSTFGNYVNFVSELARYEYSTF